MELYGVNYICMCVHVVYITLNYYSNTAIDGYNQDLTVFTTVQLF